MLQVFERLRSAFSNINLMIEEKKCEIYCSSSPLLNTICQSTSIPATSQECRILGTPIGSSLYIIESCSDVAQSGSNLCGKLLQLQDPHAVWYALAEILSCYSDELPITNCST